MALIHQNLYEESENENVDFDVFISQLFTDLELAFKPADTNITVKINSNNVLLDMQLALYLGLVLNELVTNSYKYAFVNRTDGFINLSITKLDKKIRVIYFDDGVGLDSNFDDAKAGFGFKLIRILTEQINATFQYDYQNKLATYIITIDEPT